MLIHVSKREIQSGGKRERKKRERERERGGGGGKEYYRTIVL